MKASQNQLKGKVFKFRAAGVGLTVYVCVGVGGWSGEVRRGGLS